jgi:hypothetical protein
LKAKPKVCNVVTAQVKMKQKVSGFRLDDKTIYAWFRDDLKLSSPSTSALSLKKKAQNNFGIIRHKERQVEVEDGKSQRIASNSSKIKKPKLKPKSSQPPTAGLHPSISSTSTIESNSYRHYPIKDFLYANVGNRLPLQIALDHPNFDSYSRLYATSKPKPLRQISGRTFLQLPCVVMMCTCLCPAHR